jgi:hypothetical protein
VARFCERPFNWLIQSSTERSVIFSSFTLPIVRAAYYFSFLCSVFHFVLFLLCFSSICVMFPILLVSLDSSSLTGPS